MRDLDVKQSLGCYKPVTVRLVVGCCKVSTLEVLQSLIIIAIQTIVKGASTLKQNRYSGTSP